MRETWIVESKLTPPSPPQAYMQREFPGVPRPLPPVTALVAGPGYGKTLGMLALARPAVEAGATLVWFGLDLYDAEVASFFHYLVAGVRAHIPQFGEEVSALLIGEKLEPRLLWQRFFSSIAAYNLPSFVLAIDDVHHLIERQGEILKALAYFFDKLPPRTHLLLASRQRLPGSFGRLEAQGQLVRLEQPQLRFSAEEEVAFMRQRAPGGQIPNAWWKQATGLDGWPLGLDLATGVAESRDARLDVRGNRDQLERLTAYVAEELFGAQSTERQAFMLQAALLQELTPEACRWVFQARDAAEHLAGLEEAHLLQRLAGSVAYRFPTYLRDYLSSEAERTIPELTVASWHRRAAAFYQDRGQEELALPHQIASRDWANAAVACDLAFPAMRFSGRQNTIGRWLEAFPAEVAEANPLVQLWRGHYFSRTGSHPDALVAYERAYALFGDRGDAAGQFKVQVRQLTIALIQQDMKRFGSLLMAAMAAQRLGRDEDLVDLHLARALAAEQRGDMALMEECNSAVLDVPTGDNHEIAASQCIALLNLYTSALHRGDLGVAGNRIARAVELADTWRFVPYHLFASFLQAHLQLLVGEVEAAGVFLRGLPGHWPDLLDWHDLACAYAVLGHYHELQSEWREAEDALRRSLATFEKAGFVEGKKVPLERLLWVAVQRKQYARTGELLASAGERAAQNIYDMVLVIPHARAMHLHGRSGEALDLLEATVPALEGLGAELHLAKALLYEGAARLTLGDAPGADRVVGRALAIAEARDYAFLRTQDRGLWAELAPLINRPAASGAPAALLPALEPAEPAPTRARGRKPAAAPPDEAPALPLDAPARAPGRLSCHCFGGFELRLDGVRLDQWPRRKAKLILAGLMLYRRGLPLAELAELLGAQTVTPATLTTLKVDVLALRRTLEPDLAKGEASRFVALIDDRYVLNPEAIAFSDLAAFDADAVAGDACRDADPLAAAAAYTRALATCRGNLLADALFRGAFEAERQQYRMRAVAIALWLAGFHQGRGDFSAAEAALRRAVDLAPCDEEAYIELMRLQMAQGRPERVRQVYWDCRKAIKAELGLAPSEAFESAYKLIAAA